LEGPREQEDDAHCPLFLSLAMAAAIYGDASAAAPRPAHSGAIRLPPLHASGLTTLYDQTGMDSGIGLVSQNFEDDFDIYDDVIADDFVVPDDKRWKLREIEITGTYFDGIGPAASLNIAIHRNRNSLPGRMVAAYDGIETYGDQQGTFSVRLPKGLTLKSGRYWISVQATMDFIESGEWGWETASIATGIPAVFQNPGDGFATGCTSWAPVATCLPYGEGDMLFALRGRES